MRKILIGMVLVVSFCLAAPTVNLAADTAVSNARAEVGRRSGTPIVVNSATFEELQALRGVGPVLARKIIDYREKNGPFENVDDLLGVSGIGPLKLKLFRDLVQIAPAE